MMMTPADWRMGGKVGGAMISQGLSPHALRSIQQKTSLLRRQNCEHSLRAFAKTYLPAHFKCEPSAMHLDLFEILENSIDDRGCRAAIAAPRSHAKSTIVSLAFPLWCICYKK